MVIDGCDTGECFHLVAQAPGLQAWVRAGARVDILAGPCLLGGDPALCFSALITPDPERPLLRARGRPAKRA